MTQLEFPAGDPKYYWPWLRSTQRDRDRKMTYAELSVLHEDLSQFVTQHGTARDEEHVHALQQRIRRLMGRMRVRNDG